MNRHESSHRRTATLTSVVGGQDLELAYAEADDLALLAAHAGMRLIAWSLETAAMTTAIDLVGSAAFAPVTFARAAEALLEASLGRHGLGLAAARCEALAVAIPAAVEVIRRTDEGEVAWLWLDAKEVLGLEAPDLPIQDRFELGAAGALAFATAALGPRGTAALSWLSSGKGGPDTGVRTVRVGLQVGSGTSAPGDVADLATHLGQLGELSDADHPENDGTVEVQTLVGADRTVRHVVYLPGTDDMSPLSHDAQVRDMTGNLRLMSGQSTAYGAGVLAAMTAAGIRPHEPVLIAGHSQGGMQALALAAEHSPYDVTNVVTFGSPTAQPHGQLHGTHVLALEHVGDVVPQLAGAPAQPSADQVTVRFSSGVEGVAGNHDLLHYTVGAEAIDSSPDPAVADQLASMAGFFSPGQSATSQVFQLTRER